MSVASWGGAGAACRPPTPSFLLPGGSPCGMPASPFFRGGDSCVARGALCRAVSFFFVCLFALRVRARACVGLLLFFGGCSRRLVTCTDGGTRWAGMAEAAVHCVQACTVQAGVFIVFTECVSWSRYRVGLAFFCTHSNFAYRPMMSDEGDDRGRLVTVHVQAPNRSA